MYDNAPNMQFGIINAYNYFDEIVRFNWIDFQKMSTPRAAFNLANSIWSIMDWISHDPVHQMYNSKKEDICKKFQAECPALCVLHDLATHGKHYTVSAPRSNAEVDSSDLTGAVLSFSPFGIASEHVIDFLVVTDDGKNTPLIQVFQEAIDFWEQYFKTLSQSEYNNQ